MKYNNNNLFTNQLILWYSHIYYSVNEREKTIDTAMKKKKSSDI